MHRQGDSVLGGSGASRAEVGNLSTVPATRQGLRCGQPVTGTWDFHFLEKPQLRLFGSSNRPGPRIGSVIGGFVQSNAYRYFC